MAEENNDSDNELLALFDVVEKAGKRKVEIDAFITKNKMVRDNESMAGATTFFYPSFIMK